VDIWAFGCIFHELVLGTRAFKSDWEVREYGLSQDPFPVPKVAFADKSSVQFFTRIIERTLEREWNLRPAAKTLSFDFERFADSLISRNSTISFPKAFDTAPLFSELPSYLTKKVLSKSLLASYGPKTSLVAPRASIAGPTTATISFPKRLVSSQVPRASLLAPLLSTASPTTATITPVLLSKTVEIHSEEEGWTNDDIKHSAEEEKSEDETEQLGKKDVVEDELFTLK